MKKLQVLLIAFSLTFTSCLSVSKSVLAPNPTGRIMKAEYVQVFFETDSLPDHTRLAILNAKGDDGTTSEGAMIDKLREEAGKLGANAIVLGDIKDATTGAKVASFLFGTSANRKGRAIAIYAPSLDKVINKPEKETEKSADSMEEAEEPDRD
ncbi:MAG: hypothetical protein ACRBF0_01135 [Calditrichia bacterium]